MPDNISEIFEIKPTATKNTQAGHKRVIYFLIGVAGWFAIYLGIVRHLNFNEMFGDCTFECNIVLAIYQIYLGFFYLGIPLFLVIMRRGWIATGFVMAALATTATTGIPTLIKASIKDENSNYWITYTSANSGLSEYGAYITDLQIDAQDRVWIGTGNYGLTVLTPDGEWTTYTTSEPGEFDADVNAVVSDTVGNVWVGTDKDLRRLDASDKWTSYTVADIGQPCCFDNHLAIDQENRIWVGGAEGLSVRESDGSWTIYTLANSGLSNISVTGLEIDSNGQVWASTADGRLNLLTTDGRWVTYLIPVSQVPDSSRDILVDEHGRVWVTTSRGPCVLETDGTWTTFEVPEPEWGYSGDTLVIDQQGRLWAGTYSAGLRVFTPETGWASYTIDNSGLATDAQSNLRENAPILALAVDKRGRLWIGTNNGLQVFDVNSLKSGQ